jgi:hypothetical protein
MDNFAKKTLAVLLGIAVALLLLEIACQVFFAFVVVKSLEAQRSDPFHYYTASVDPVLRYELKPGYRMEKEGRRIAVNSAGIRDDREPDGDARKKVALLGDSVPFGIALSQEETPAARLQALTGDSMEVLNFGTPGYGLEEIQRFLELKFPVYQPGMIYYVLNLNDFSRRNTIYEGADNGLYRIYHRPFLKMPFFIRKAVYRFVKEGKMSSERWYRWLFEGNKVQGLAMVKQMADFAKQHGSGFSVVLFPPAVAYDREGFHLQDVFDEICAYLKENGIPCLAPVEEFSTQPLELQDNTDHFTPAGCRVLAQYIWQDLQNSE